MEIKLPIWLLASLEGKNPIAEGRKIRRALMEEAQAKVVADVDQFLVEQCKAYKISGEELTKLTATIHGLALTVAADMRGLGDQHWVDTRRETLESSIRQYMHDRYIASLTKPAPPRLVISGVAELPTVCDVSDDGDVAYTRYNLHE